jgi:hypothetical protein
MKYFLVLACLVLHTLGAFASEVVLTVSAGGALASPNKSVSFTMEQLTKLPQLSFTTQTPWYDNPVKFTGPFLKDVLNAAGVSGQRIWLIALNNYQVETPVIDMQRYPILIARLINDKPMAIRDKGPLFVVYPYGQYSELKKELYYSRSVWQLSKIHVQ